MRTAIYTRISEDPTGEALGVQRQFDDCAALAERLGWDIVSSWADNDISAYSGKTRPGFEAMLDAMARGEFGALVCWHPDRLYRSMRDLERVIEVADERGVQLRTVTAGDLNLGTPAGRMLARILGSVARQEVEHKGERQRRANQQKRAAGKWVRTGLRKFAYTHDGEPFEPEASALRKAADDVLTGKSLRGIAIAWNERGLRTTRGNKFTSMQVRRTLINPLYAGLVTHHEKVVGRGEWPPIIDEATHHGLVAYLSDPARRPAVSFEKRHMGSGVYRCGKCGARLYATYPGGKNRGMTYTCRPSSHISRLGEPLDKYVELVLLEYLSRTDIHVLLEDGSTVDVGELQTRREALQARLDELAAMFAEGAIDGSQLKRGTNELRSQVAEVDGELGQLTRRNPAAELVAEARGKRDKLEKHWHALTPDMKGKVVDELMTVTVNAAPRGRKGFNPEYVDITPKGTK